MSERIQSALNNQINLELSAFYTYLSMSAFFTAQGLDGFAAWMRHHSDEEMMHAMKLYDFVHARRGRVHLDAIDAPQWDWDTTLAAFESALHHEQKVTASINALVDLAREERDHATVSFLQWFVDEQVEEEALVDKVISDVRRVSDFPPGLFLLDRELGSQSGQGQAGGEGNAT